MSYSWVDPHFAALYARREEERLAERLVTRLRERSLREPSLQTISWRQAGWMENDAVLRGGHLRLRKSIRESGPTCDAAEGRSGQGSPSNAGSHLLSRSSVSPGAGSRMGRP